MEKDKIFFGEKGISSTHANYLANLCKEFYQDIEKKLNQAVFFTSEVSLIGSSEKNTLKEGVDSYFLNTIDNNLKVISEYKSLIAWIKEAIKAKERLIKEAKNLSDEEICRILEIEFPARPVSHTRLTADDIIATWNIKQRNRYYYLETLCAVYGSYVHPDGALANGRQNLIKVDTCKNEFSGQGRDMVIFHYEPTCSVEEVNKVFFEIQAKYREFQAELNSMKHEIELKLQEDDREKSALERTEAIEYQSKIRVVNAQCNEYRNKAVADAQALKIIIPDSLKSIYEFVFMAGKEK